MTSVLPHRFLFRYEFAIPRVADVPRRKGGRLLDLDERCLIPDPGGLDDVPESFELRAAWNPHGLGFQLTVRGKRQPPRGDADKPLAADGLQVWIDTRGTQNVHRATRFCHSFCFLPGAGQGACAAGRQVPIPRARDDAPQCEPEDLLVLSEVTGTGYWLEAWLPAAVLHGFDPEAQSRLGFCYVVRDTELGTQGLPLGADYPYDSDPSLWGVLNLVSGDAAADVREAGPVRQRSRGQPAGRGTRSRGEP